MQLGSLASITRPLSVAILVYVGIYHLWEAATEPASTPPAAAQPVPALAPPAQVTAAAVDLPPVPAPRPSRAAGEDGIRMREGGALFTLERSAYAHAYGDARWAARNCPGVGLDRRRHIAEMSRLGFQGFELSEGGWGWPDVTGKAMMLDRALARYTLAELCADVIRRFTEDGGYPPIIVFDAASKPR
jgi:hypothetical protein